MGNDHSTRNHYRSRKEKSEEDVENSRTSLVSGEKRGRLRSKSWIANEHFLACNPSYLMSFLDVQELARMEQVCSFNLTFLLRYTHPLTNKKIYMYAFRRVDCSVVWKNPCLFLKWQHGYIV